MNKIFTDIQVALIDSMGSDLTVVNSARVSFDKVSSEINEKDVKLINYLAKHQHWSPFSHCFAQFRVKAPIFVARQLQKHTVGLAWNEVSRRYVDSPPEIYYPDYWRQKSENKKQGSSEERIYNDNQPFYDEIEETFLASFNKSLETYQVALAAGVCPEQARMLLPQAMQTEWYWSGSLYAFARVCKLRLDITHSQRETAEVAEKINSHMKKLFPNSWKALIEN